MFEAFLGPQEEKAHGCSPRILIRRPHRVGEPPKEELLYRASQRASAGGEQKTAALQPPKKPKRAVSAYESYLVERFADEKVAGGTMNFVGFTSSWRKEQRRKWLEEEPQEIVTYHEDIAEAAKVVAKEARRDYRKQMKEYQAQLIQGSIDKREIMLVEDIVRGGQDIQPCVSSDATPTDALALRPIDGFAALRDETQEDAIVVESAGDAMVSTDRAIVPVALKGHRQIMKNYNSREHAAQHFKTQVSHIATDKGSIAGPVSYETPCWDCCCRARPALLRAFQAKCLKHFASIAAALPGKNSCSGMKNHCVATRLRGLPMRTGNGETWYFGMLDSALGRSGHQPPHQCFTLYELEGTKILRAVPDDRQYKGNRRGTSSTTTLLTHFNEHEFVALLTSELQGKTGAELEHTHCYVEICQPSCTPAIWSPDFGWPEEHNSFILESMGDLVVIPLNVEVDVEDEAADFVGMYAAPGHTDDKDLDVWLVPHLDVGLPGGAGGGDGDVDEGEGSNDDGSDPDDGVDSSDEEDPDGDGGGPPPPDPVYAVCRELNLHQDTEKFIDVATGRVIATQRAWCGEKRPVLTFTCGWHASCNLVMQCLNQGTEKTVESIRWANRGRDCSAEEHAADAVRVKAGFGIKSRPRAE